ncbi:MAG: amidohydrolase family protein [Hyphomicrobiaceae bacterium]
MSEGQLCIQGVRCGDGTIADISCRAGHIARIAARIEPAAHDVSLNATGYVVLPALVEPHVHLDKTLWGEPWRANTAGPTIPDYIVNERRVLAEVKTPIIERSARLLEQMIAMGSLTIRSHVDVAVDAGLDHVEAMLALRERYRDVVDLQLVAFPQMGLLIRPGTAELMEESLKLGVETVGGIDPAGIDNDPIGQLRVVFGLAEKYDRGVDIHLHDPGELGVWQIERIADFAAASGLEGRVMISHAYCLGMVARSRIEKLAHRLAELRISLMSSAPADIAVPPVAYLREMGVTVCAGSDGIRDAWSPMGNGDALERAWLMAYRFDWSKDDQLLAALDAVTGSAARAIGRDVPKVEPGAPANLVLVKAINTQDALLRRPCERIVIKGGRVVARDGVYFDPPMSFET